MKLELRWVCYFAALLILVNKLIGRRRVPRNSNITTKKFYFLLGLLSTIYFCLGLASKWTQYLSLKFSAHDFWLYEDILNNIQSGGYFITRFEYFGFTQHGAVHQQFILFFLKPFVWLIGSLGVALAYGPVFIALAGFLLGVLAQPRWGNKNALLISLAFLLSSAVNKVLMYETHPESAYAFFVFLWALGLSEALPRNRAIKILCLVLGILGAAGLKEDSFLIFIPLGVTLTFFGKAYRRYAILTLIVTLAGFLVNLKIASLFKEGFLGPTTWLGHPVEISGGFYQGKHWDSLASAIDILNQFVKKWGGWVGAGKQIIGVILSRPYLSLILLFPWIVREKIFWSSTLCLISCYALLGGQPARLENYYGASVLAILWLVAIFFIGPRNTIQMEKKVFWLLLCALGLDRGGLIYYAPSAEVAKIKTQAVSLAKCLGKRRAEGLVSTPLIGLVPRQSIYTERVPISADVWGNINFILMAPMLSSFETSSAELLALREKIQKTSNWSRLNSECKKEKQNSINGVELYVRQEK